MEHRLPGSRENYFDRHDIDEVIEKMWNYSFNRLTPEEAVEERIKNIIVERDNRIRELEGHLEKTKNIEARLKELEVLYQEKLKIKK